MPIDRYAIVTVARSYVGLPFVHQGRGTLLPDGTRQGLDCVGLVLRVAWDLGIPLEDWTGYSPRTDGVLLTEQCQQQLVSIPLEAIAPGDLVQWVEPQSVNGPPCNIAIVGYDQNGFTLVHAAVEHQRVVTHGYRAPWTRLTVAAWRYPGNIAPWLPVIEEA